jgi:hypothetical protein
MKAIYALYADGQTAQQAINRLRAAGVPHDQITVLSSRPMEEFEFGQAERRTYMWWIASAGGLLGMAAAVGIAWVTETWWPLNVGGLPTFAWWPNLIIMFEMMMLGAILATVITLVVTAGLGRRRGLYDPEVSEGAILVGVEAPAADKKASIESALTAVAGKIKSIGD